MKQLAAALRDVAVEPASPRHREGGGTAKQLAAAVRDVAAERASPRHREGGGTAKQLAAALRDVAVEPASPRHREGGGTAKQLAAALRDVAAERASPRCRKGSTVKQVRRTSLAAALVACTACTTQDNLGNHVFGEARWSVALGTSGEDRATAIAVDPIGNVIVAGTCDGVVDFGSGAVDCYGAFITQRESQTGSEQWTVRIADARVTALARTDDAIVASGTLDTGAGVDSFIATFDLDGGWRSWTPLGLAGAIISPATTVAANGRVFTAGGFVRNPPSTGTVSNNDDTLDGYVSSQYHDGTYAWTAPFVGDGVQRGTQLTVADTHDLAVVAETSADMMVDGELIASAEPSRLLLRWSPVGKLMWSKPLDQQVERVALTPKGDVIVAACPFTYLLDRDGNERWRVDCKDDLASIDSVTVSPEGLIVIGGHHNDSEIEDGELFLVAFDSAGNLISSARTLAFPEPADSSIDAIAVEPTGEVVFVTSASHAFDFGNGMLPHVGAHDVVIAKLDSTTGRDGQVLLTRPAP